MNEPFPCRDCGQSFATLVEFDAHVKTHPDVYDAEQAAQERQLKVNEAEFVKQSQTTLDIIAKAAEVKRED